VPSTLTTLELGSVAIAILLDCPQCGDTVVARTAEDAEERPVVGIVCAQCGARVIAAVRSEYVNERCVRNLWSCETCGYEFETEAHFAPLNKDLREPRREFAD
jgi:predicted RNA-binding Zn-ribbon protein involved in translation (DUF1610 family)